MNEELFKDDVEKTLAVLQSGGIILYPTDTIWGIGCDATNFAAVEKIIQLKQRPKQKSFVVLVADEKDILRYTAMPDLSVFDYLQTVIKPTTVIYEHALGLADNVCNDDGSVAIRICHDAFCKPIVSTSANISGKSSPKNFTSIETIIKDNVDYIVNYRQDDFAESESSSIIKWKNGKPEIIRS